MVGYGRIYGYWYTIVFLRYRRYPTVISSTMPSFEGRPGLVAASPGTVTPSVDLTSIKDNKSEDQPWSSPKLMDNGHEKSSTPFWKFLSCEVQVALQCSVLYGVDMTPKRWSTCRRHDLVATILIRPWWRPRPRVAAAPRQSCRPTFAPAPPICPRAPSKSCSPPWQSSRMRKLKNEYPIHPMTFQNSSWRLCRKKSEFLK